MEKLKDLISRIVKECEPCKCGHEPGNKTVLALAKEAEKILNTPKDTIAEKVQQISERIMYHPTAFVVPISEYERVLLNQAGMWSDAPYAEKDKAYCMGRHIVVINQQAE